MSSAGEILRAERERQGLELTKVSAQTRISVKYLRAIEGDDPSSLPGTFFYRSFVHQYADFLGIDHDAVDSELENIAPIPPASEPLQNDRFLNRVDISPLPSESRSSSPNRLPLALVFLVTTIIASSAIYVLWERSQQPGETHLETQAASPPKRASAGEQPKPQSQTSVPVTPGQAPAPQQPIGTSTGGAAAPQTPPENEAKPLVQTSAAVTQTPSSGEQVSAPVKPGNPISLEFMATEEVWVSATSDGNEVVKRVLKPGEKRVLTGNGKVTLLTGNAGGLIVTANGKLLNQIGPRGQVRIVEVTPQGAQVRGPVSKKPAEEEQ
jgi:cytoskeletal protein RodZ